MPYKERKKKKEKIENSTRKNWAQLIRVTLACSVATEN